MGNRGSSSPSSNAQGSTTIFSTLNTRRKSITKKKIQPSALLARINQDLPDQSSVVRTDVFSANCIDVDLGPACKGSGALVLTKDQLWFSLGHPRIDIFIQLLDIEDIRTNENHYANGKVVKEPVLTITYDDPALRAENRLHLRFDSHHPENDCAEWEEAVGRQINLCRRQLSSNDLEGQGRAFELRDA